ncbi:MAG: hypothetical protein H6854_01000 [Rhodospirillales bacterium]|nr:hypothetical protein [Rhodospirillales bacterium]
MLNTLKNNGLKFTAALTVALLSSGSAFAGGGGGGGGGGGAATLSWGATGNDLKEMTEEFIGSTNSLPGLISIVAYISGLSLGVLGVLKLKDHVENPSQTPLKDGAVRLAAGGALLALPFLYEVIVGSLANGTGQASQVIQLQGINTARTVG